MARGGARPNSGPKPGTKHEATLAKEVARARYQERMTRRFDALLDVQFETATGISQFVYRDEAGRFKVIDDPDELAACLSQGKALRIFTRLPNAQAQTDILNRTMDKPKEQEQVISISGELTIVEARLLTARKRLAAKNP